MLENYLLKIGFTTDQISFVRNSYKFRHLSESNILNNYKKTCNLLHKYNLSDKDLIDITVTIPDILYISFESIKKKMDDLSNLGFNKLEIKSITINYPYIINTLTNKIKNIFDFFKQYNININLIKKVIISNPYIINKDNILIEKNIKTFLNKGYKTNEVINLYLETDFILDISSTQLNEIFKYYNNIGFNNMEFINLTMHYPNLLIKGDKTIKGMFLNLKKYGFNIDIIVDILKKIPIILKKYYFNNIYNKLNLLEEFNFSKKNIIKIVSTNPYILLHSNNYLTLSYNTYFQLCDDLNIINDIILNEPLLLGYCPNAIIDRINFFKKYNYINQLIKKPVFLTYTIDYLNKRRDIVTNNDDFFLSDKQFFDKYKKTYLDIFKELN